MAERTLRLEESVLSPYFLHPGENPSLVLVSSLLTEENYHQWCRAMRKALLSKNKFKFVNGTIPVPHKDDTTYEAWERCNNMVTSWLSRAVSPSISHSISCLDNAVDVWNDLQDRFSQGDSARLGDLLEEAYAFHQNNLSVTDYYTHLKTLWDEILSLRPLPSCTCEPKCNCGMAAAVKLHWSNDQTIKFLKGLNDSFATVRSQIIMTEPLPKINKVFSLVIQHERLITGRMSNTNEPVAFMARGNDVQKGNPASNYNAEVQNHDSNVFYAGSTRGRGFNNYRGNNRGRGFVQNWKPTCSHCGYGNHTVDSCYKKHGYPPGYQPRYRPESSQANHVESAGYYTDDNLSYSQDHSNGKSPQVFNSSGSNTGFNIRKEKEEEKRMRRDILEEHMNKCQSYSGT
ncbi:uncharacterized protein LOC126665505 [Mercurialis annua]|uniref:uncharacterized protein LOC126665505 n=1 Tax=Mercurialis annua TaxID=3986 RepID=UPI0021604881|nr:uncharacterized protein LOC126665505 [Mercurialis annua]